MSSYYQSKRIFVKDGETLLRAKSDIERGKSLVVNKYNEKVYTLFFGSKGNCKCDSRQWRCEDGSFGVDQI